MITYESLHELMSKVYVIIVVIVIHNYGLYNLHVKNLKLINRCELSGIELSFLSTLLWFSVMVIGYKHKFIIQFIISILKRHNS